MSLEILEARKRFGAHRAVDGVSAALRAGEFFVVLGPSGCGKSTLLRLVAGLEELDGGEIRLDGETVSGPSRHAPPEERRVGVVFQSYALWPHLSVRENVAFPAKAQGARSAEARSIAERHLETVALSDFAERRPAALSGGQRQRVALARCLAGGARMVLMDEPLANLDPHLRERMESEIGRFHREAGVTTLYITHDQREAMALADRIAVMWEGRFIQVAPPQEIHDRPSNERVARFIGRAAILDGVVSGSEAGAVAEIGALRAPLANPAPAGPARIAIRPRDVRLQSPDAAAGAPARLEAVFYRGGAWEARARIDGLAEPLPVASETPLRQDDMVALSLKGGWALPT